MTTDEHSTSVSSNSHLATPIRVHSDQATRYTEANSYRLGWYPGMVSATRGAYFRRAAMSTLQSTISDRHCPQSMETTVITPVAKVPRPTYPSDYRPISVTPVLLRLLEKLIVSQYIYPLLRQPSTALNFEDQFAFRPSGSTDAAIITLLHAVCSMLTTSDYMHVFAFDFSKAFDTVRHYTLMTKMMSLELPDNIYNWINDFFRDRQHCTWYAGQSSSVAATTASIIQGSGLGPASHIITAVDLHPVTNGNRIVQFADDTNLVVPASNSSSRLLEIDYIQTWAAGNNLMLNCSKSKEIIFIAWGKHAKSVQLPLPCLHIERVSSLGVIVNDQLRATDHVSNILASCKSLLYALRILRSHGIPVTSLHDVFRATVIAKLTYCAPSWSGACSATDCAKLVIRQPMQETWILQQWSANIQWSYWWSWRYSFHSNHG